MRVSFVFLFFFCALAFVESKSAKYCCGENEEWLKCGGCDACCMNPEHCCDKKGPPGCYCKDGYVRDEYGNCILVCDCPQCGCNEEYRCGTCDPTCENPKKKCCCPCKPGCFCKRGYVRNYLGKCIPLKDCCKYKKHRKSGSNE